MATTTNYGWTTPDDTALVKDGAAAIRTLGSSVDTTTKNLNPSTTLGDIEYRSSTANTNTRLGIGTTGQVLTVSGGVPAWSTISAGGLTLLSTTTLSGASTTISGIDQTYTHLFVSISGITNATADGINYVAPNYSGGQTTSTQEIANGSITQENSYIRLTSSINATRTDANNSWQLQIYNYASTTFYKPVFWSGYFQVSGGSRSVLGGGGYYNNSAVSSLWFLNGGGNFSTGTVRIYGVK
jgi:hypothetical protein